MLAGRKTTGKVEGAVRFGGQPKRATTAFLRRYTGYVEQFGASTLNCITQNEPQSSPLAPGQHSLRPPPHLSSQNIALNPKP